MTTFVAGNAVTATQPQAMASHPVGPAPMAVNYQHAVIVQTNSNQSSRYSAKRGRTTGWVQLACACSAFVLGVVQAVVGSQVSIVGYGIWGGILFFLPSGILGVVSHNRNTCVIVGYMVMSIISSIAALSVIGLGFTSAFVSASERCSFIGVVADCDYDTQQARIAMDSLITIVGFVEFITAIVAASLCCAGVCCGTRQPNTVVMQYSNNPAHVVLMSQPAYTQHQMAPPYAQPNAYVPHQLPQSSMTQPTYPQDPSSARVTLPGGYPEAPPPQYTPSPGFNDNTCTAKS